MRVIRAESSHVFDFCDLVKEFLDEGIDKYGWGVNTKDLHTTYHLWDKDYAFLLEDEGCIVGILAGVVAPHFFNYENFYFHENMWFVKKDYRRSGGGLMLYRACVQRCHEKGIKRLVFGHTIQMKDEFEKIFKSLGFTYLESHYEKVL